MQNRLDRWFLSGLPLILLVLLISGGPLSTPLDRSEMNEIAIRPMDSQRLEGATISFYDNGRLQTRMSVKELRIGPPKLVGPVRIGFLRGVEASEVLVQAFSEDQPPAEPGDRSAPKTTAPVLRQACTEQSRRLHDQAGNACATTLSADPQAGRAPSVPPSEPISHPSSIASLLVNQVGESGVFFNARSCRTSLPSGHLVCSNGERTGRSARSDQSPEKHRKH